MSISTVRSILAILIVGVFMFITGFLAIYPVITNQQIDLSSYTAFYEKTAAAYTGIIGVIIGYYFARTQELAKKEEGKG